MIYCNQCGERHEDCKCPEAQITVSTERRVTAESGSPSSDWVGAQPCAADTCPKCGGIDWYQVGNLRCCFACAEGFIVGSGKAPTVRVIDSPGQD